LSPRRKPNPRIARHRYHDDNLSSNRANTFTSNPPSADIRHPSESSISIQPDGTAAKAGGGLFVASISTGKNTGSASFAATSGSGAYRSSRSHLKIRLAFLL